MLQRELLYAAMGTGATCLATVLGAAMVFFFKKEMSAVTQKVFLGFAAGVMIAASVWSLLIPPWRWRKRPAAPCSCRWAAALCWAACF